jgi:UDPglucose 6-dehydrogenase
MSVIQQIARRIEEEKIIVIKSTVPVGTAELVEKVFIENSQHRCEVVSCPEFLREGTAVADFMNPGRIVIGARREATARQVLEVYRPFLRKDTPVFIMDNRSAELTKYAANLALAARISLINELARLAEVVGADIELVRRAVGADPRIGNAYMLPGVGFGGSCLPKDVRALVRIGQDHGIRLRMAEAILAVNDEQVLWFMQKILRHFQNSLRGKRITVWGLAFKPNTDDVRESVSLRIVEELITRGAVVTVYDPKAMLAARTVLGDRVNYAEEMYTSLSEAEALVVVTEWEEFVHADLKEMVLRMRKPVLFDGRNIYNPSELREVGFVYYGVGRSGELRNTPSWEG